MKKLTAPISKQRLLIPSIAMENDISLSEGFAIIDIKNFPEKKGKNPSISHKIIQVANYIVEVNEKDQTIAYVGTLTFDSRQTQFTIQDIHPVNYCLSYMFRDEKRLDKKIKELIKSLIKDLESDLQEKKDNLSKKLDSFSRELVNIDKKLNENKSFNNLFDNSLPKEINQRQIEISLLKENIAAIKSYLTIED